MKEESRRAWHGAGADLRFEPADFEVVDLVLGQVPELRICAMALKRARAKHLKYPVKDAAALAGLLENGRFVGGGHAFVEKDIGTFMPPEFFPIHDEGEFVSRMYIALVRCRHEEHLKQNSSPEALKGQHASSEGGRQ
jgi:hypothetical protein